MRNFETFKSSQDFLNLPMYLTFLIFPISERLGTLLLIIASIVGLISGSIKLVKRQAQIKKEVIVYTLFLVLLLWNSLFFNVIGNLEQISKYAFFSLSFLVFVNWNSKDDKTFSPLDWLVLGVIASIIISIIRFLANGSFPIAYADIESYTLVHPLYFSLYLLISINHVLFKRKFNHRIKIGLVVILVLFLLISQSRIAFIALALLVTNYLIFERKFKLVIASAVLLTLVVLSLNLTEKTPLKSAINERFQIWETSIQLISKSPFIGYGISNEQNALDQQYFNEAKFNLLDRKLNGHNMYLTTLIELGLFGLVLLVVLFALPLILNGKELDPEYLGFVLIIGLCCITESIFLRNWSMLIIISLTYYTESGNSNN